MISHEYFPHFIILYAYTLHYLVDVLLANCELEEGSNKKLSAHSSPSRSFTKLIRMSSVRLELIFDVFPRLQASEVKVEYDNEHFCNDVKIFILVSKY